MDHSSRVMHICTFVRLKAKDVPDTGGGLRAVTTEQHVLRHLVLCQPWSANRAPLCRAPLILCQPWSTNRPTHLLSAWQLPLRWINSTSVTFHLPRVDLTFDFLWNIFSGNIVTLEMVCFYQGQNAPSRMWQEWMWSICEIKVQYGSGRQGLP